MLNAECSARSNAACNEVQNVNSRHNDFYLGTEGMLVKGQAPGRVTPWMATQLFYVHVDLRSPLPNAPCHIHLLEFRQITQGLSSLSQASAT